VVKAGLEELEAGLEELGEGVEVNEAGRELEGVLHKYSQVVSQTTSATPNSTTHLFCRVQQLQVEHTSLLPLVKIHIRDTSTLQPRRV
jgi:hypothetical protein